ncbi:hypothetical protein D3Z38_03085 [Clostridiales bacterium]|jgi:hypothetical protein|nr:hypothetical protein [Clostridiales bacterium]
MVPIIGFRLDGSKHGLGACAYCLFFVSLRRLTTFTHVRHLKNRIEDIIQDIVDCSIYNRNNEGD